MIEKITIYGERCSGTNYLECLIKENFHKYELTWEYGHKHFFGHQDRALKNSDNTLFICIVRNPIDWLNSFYKQPHHIIDINCHSIENFLNNEVVSFQRNSKSFNNKNGNQGNERMDDRHIYTKKRYKNIFELRHTKLKYMIEDLPNKVDNYIFIKYEDLLNNFENTMIKIKNKGLNVKPNIQFPLNYYYYKDTKILYIKKKTILEKTILNNPNLIKYYEELLGYM